MASIAPNIGPGLLLEDHGRIAGQLFDQPHLSNGQRLDDWLGYRAVLIRRHMKDDLRHRSGIRVMNAADHPEVAAFLDARGLGSILVRPDRYIAGSSTKNSFELAGQWIEMTGVSE